MSRNQNNFPSSPAGNERVRLDLAFEAFNEGAYDYDIVINRMSYSDRLRELLHVHASSLNTAEDWLALIHPADITGYRRAMSLHFKGQTERFEHDYRYRATDGAWRWARQHGIAIRDGDGRAMRLVGSAGDITELKETATSLRLSEQRYALAARAASDGIYEWDLRTQALYMPMYERVVGAYPGVALTAAHWNERVHPEDFKGYREALCAYLRSETDEFEHEYRLALPDGSWRWIQDRAIGVRDDAGRVVRIVGAVSDITTRRMAEARLRDAYTELEQKNAALQEQIEAHARAEATVAHLVEEIRGEQPASALLGHCPPIVTMLHQIDLVAATTAHVLVRGETGTGKELVARTLHAKSERASRPLVKLNCAAMPRELVESELFGHERGAFTGASARRVGRFEQADGGTLFLDEIGELPVESQAKLLRVLQDSEFERVGSSQTLRTDVRIIAATNRGLEEEVAAGRFRSDLFYRLNVFPIHVPPLRDRIGDVEVLVTHFLELASRRLGKHFEGIAPDFMSYAQSHSWPGNVRELRNMVDRCAILSTGVTLERHVEIEDWTPGQHVPDSSSGSYEPVTLEEAERRTILNALEHASGIVEGPDGAARVLDIHPSTLRGRMRRLGIKRVRTSSSER